MAERQATVRNEMGIHCRPAAVIMKEVSDCEGDISIRCRDRTTPLRSVMDLLGLGLQCGDELTVRVEGPNEDAACERMADLFETRFDFPPRSEDGAG